MYPPLKPTHLYVEIVKEPNTQVYHCNQSYIALSETVQHGMPVEGVYLVKGSETGANYRYREGGTVGRIWALAVSSVTHKILIAIDTLIPDNAGRTNTENIILYMDTDGTISKSYN